MQYEYKWNKQFKCRTEGESKLSWQFKTGGETKEEALKRANDILNKFMPELVKTAENPNYVDELTEDKEFFINELNMINQARLHKSDIIAAYKCEKANDCKYYSFVTMILYIQQATKNILRKTHIINAEVNKRK